MADNDNDVIDLWQNQTSEGFRMTQQEIQMKLRAFDAKLRVRTRDAYLAYSFLIVAFSTWAVVENDLLMRLGNAAMIIALAFLGFQAHRNRFRAVQASAIATPTIEHLRSELQRQIDFHRGKRFWSRVLLLTPAGLLFFFAFARAHPEVIAMIRFEIATFIVVMIAAIPLNLRMAKKYQRQIDELDQQMDRA
jgi:hypothetical protein